MIIYNDRFIFVALIISFVYLTQVSNSVIIRRLLKCQYTVKVVNIRVMTCTYLYHLMHMILNLYAWSVTLDHVTSLFQ